jgi:hypothetical protein
MLSRLNKGGIRAGAALTAGSLSRSTDMESVLSRDQTMR